MQLTFLYPAAGWLLLLLPLLWWTAQRPRWLRPIALRAAVFAALIPAMMQPVLIHRAGAAAQVYVLDQRPALAPAMRAEARAALARMLAEAPAGGRRTLVQIGGLPVAADVDARTTIGGGSLSVALARALDAVPLGTGAGVTLIVDPHSTDTHWEETVAALVRRGIVVDTVALARAPRPAFIGDVRADPVRVGEQAAVTVDVAGDGRDHRLTLWHGSRRLAAAVVPPSGGTAPVTLRFPAERAGFLPLRAVLDDAGGTDFALAVQDPLRILYLGDRQAGAAPLLQRLLGRGFAVVPHPAAALARTVDPARFPLVWLDDVAAARWPAATQRRLAGAVADAGVGLLATGGRAAFGPGGYAGTPLAPALPVTARAEERRERPSVALAVVIDSSGSMDGTPLDLAKQVARQTVRKLAAPDRVGVVEFYGAKQWAVPMQHARDTAAVERTIGRMQAQGASMLFPALQEAYYGLKDLDVRYKHILVVSDGGVAEDRYRQLLRHIADDRINVSTVVVGTDSAAEENMAAWARIGRGRFYSVPDEFSLVAIDFNQPQTRAEPGYRTGTFRTAAAGAGWWQGLSPEAMPPLAGLARVRTRDAADTLLAAATGDPVLASWHYGSGRVTAFATEPLGDGTRGWRGWPDYGRWLARIAAVTARQRPAMDVAVTRRFDRLTVGVQRLDGGIAPPAIRLVTADGQAAGPVLAAEARAPGLFVATVPLAPARTALVEVRAGDQVVRAADRAASDRSPADAIPARRVLPLARLSAATGGWHRARPSLPPGPAARGSGRAAADLWPWLALLALALYLLDILQRRRPARPSPSARAR